MDSILSLGLLLLLGFVFGEVFRRFSQPKIAGYLLAGIALNPGISPLVDSSFIEHTELVTDVSLAFITFCVGAELQIHKLQKMKTTIWWVAILSSLLAFLSVLVGLLIAVPWLIPHLAQNFYLLLLPFCLCMASMAAPTDPAATLAVTHQYHSHGMISTLVMSVAVLDDLIALFVFSYCLLVGKILCGGGSLHLSALGQPILIMGGSLIVGALMAYVLHPCQGYLKRQGEGVITVFVLSLVCLAYGLSRSLGLDPLLSTLTMGFIVRNFNPTHHHCVQVLEKNTEELIFVIFFSVSGMHLDFSVLVDNSPVILVFVALRAFGKVFGAWLGAYISQAPKKVRKYCGGALLPQGGIVIGLVLVIGQHPEFAPFSKVLMNIILGATVMHEILGPLITRLCLLKAGELKLGRPQKIGYDKQGPMA
jgi:Kef-type K+ transport system membrane component KefB